VRVVGVLGVGHEIGKGRWFFSSIACQCKQGAWSNTFAGLAGSRLVRKARLGPLSNHGADTRPGRNALGVVV